MLKNYKKHDKNVTKDAIFFLDLSRIESSKTSDFNTRKLGGLASGISMPNKKTRERSKKREDDVINIA